MTTMAAQRPATLDDLIQQARGTVPIRVAVANAAQAAVLGVAALMYRAGIRLPAPAPTGSETESTFHCAPQPESACCPREVC
jgi:hypothetical protein